MPWPAAPPSMAHQLPPSDMAQGGPLEAEPTTLGRAATVAYYDPSESFPGIPSDGRTYMLLEWPLPATGVTSLFGPRIDPLDGFSRQHRGVDLDAPYGAVVSAAAHGVVLEAGWNSGHGRHVVIEHASGYCTGYSHLSQVLVHPGMIVRGGDSVGLVGNSGRSTGPHLHFEVTRDSSHIDPLDVLGKPQPLYDGGQTD